MFKSTGWIRDVPKDQCERNDQSYGVICPVIFSRHTRRIKTSKLLGGNDVYHDIYQLALKKEKALPEVERL